MTRTKMNENTSGKDLKPSPNLDLRGKIGNKVIGTIAGRYEQKNFPGKFSTLLEIDETDGSTTLYDSEKKEAIEVDVAPGDKVFMKESTVLASAFSKLSIGDKVEVVYLGKGKAAKGRKAPFLYDVFKITED